MVKERKGKVRYDLKVQNGRFYLRLAPSSEQPDSLTAPLKAQKDDTDTSQTPSAPAPGPTNINLPPVPFKFGVSRIGIDNGGVICERDTD